ncbi:fibronectin type III domain-containing protein [Thioalkalivibrio thiocyanoxidans]|uniref:fibronectin type III domain-containing protein n=1 Tax=Thioalkalivibrio thiocyanoxidans TaxID=152475 RepID=UPI00037F0B1A|nr:fibronectin type III domain-containing protein [Thioalkalivibrio thiocyanoxidans]
MRPILPASLLLLLLLPLAALAEPRFDDPPTDSRDGGFTLEWNAEGAVELERASGPDFDDARVIYRGGDTSSVISGLPDGEYRFRLRAEGADDWADEARVEVAHHSLARAFGFFALGGAVFLVLIVAILRGRPRD